MLFALAFNGVFAEYKTINTKYFSIVYETSSERAASHLAENADKIADELFTYYSVKPFKSKFPIFLKPFEENLNGYYTSAPYQHIVLYDTVPVDNVLSNTTDTLLAVFTHELTHAITMKGVFSITRPLAIREGVTVITESLHGEGRLNDPRVKQLLAQDKFDGTFFQWNQIDMRDTVPGASLGYLYGGAFSHTGRFSLFYILNLFISTFSA